MHTLPLRAVTTADSDRTLFVTVPYPRSYAQKSISNRLCR